MEVGAGVTRGGVGLSLIPTSRYPHPLGERYASNNEPDALPLPLCRTPVRRALFDGSAGSAILAKGLSARTLTGVNAPGLQSAGALRLSHKFVPAVQENVVLLPPHVDAHVNLGLPAAAPAQGLGRLAIGYGSRVRPDHRCR